MTQWEKARKVVVMMNLTPKVAPRTWHDVIGPKSAAKVAVVGGRLTIFRLFNLVLYSNLFIIVIYQELQFSWAFRLYSGYTRLISIEACIGYPGKSVIPLVMN
jgi:hypothetical protein